MIAARAEQCALACFLPTLRSRFVREAPPTSLRSANSPGRSPQTGCGFERRAAPEFPLLKLAFNSNCRRLQSLRTKSFFVPSKAPGVYEHNLLLDNWMRILYFELCARTRRGNYGTHLYCVTVTGEYHILSGNAPKILRSHDSFCGCNIRTHSPNVSIRKKRK